MAAEQPHMYIFICVVCDSGVNGFLLPNGNSTATLLSGLVANKQLKMKSSR